MVRVCRRMQLQGKPVLVRSPTTQEVEFMNIKGPPNPIPKPKPRLEPLEPPTSETIFDFESERDNTLPFIILGSFVVGFVIGLLF